MKSKSNQRLRKTKIKSIDDLFLSDDDDKKYWLALGRFINSFTFVENLMNSTIQHYSGIGARLSKAILVPVRIDTAATLLTKIMDAKKIRGRKANELKSIIAHIGVINGVRNDIIHYGIFSGGSRKAKYLVISNRIFARKTTLRSHRLSYADFEKLEIDLWLIITRLMVHSQFANPRDTDFGKVMWRIYRETLHVSWHYKSRLRKKRQNKRRAKRPKPSTPPSPSLP